MKSPIEKAIDANTAAIKELTQVFKVRSKEISWAITGISEYLKKAEMTEEGAIDEQGGTAQKESPDLDQHASD